MGQAQSLINVDFGVGSRSPKVGFAATANQPTTSGTSTAITILSLSPGEPLVAMFVVRFEASRRLGDQGLCLRGQRPRRLG